MENYDMNTRIIRDLPPCVGNPRNSEGDFLRLKDGRIVFAYSAFVGESYADHAYAVIRAIFSSDEGESWSEPVELFRPSDLGECQNIMSVSFLRMADGAVGIFLIKKKSWQDTRIYLLRSYDECETFGEAVCCIPRKGYFVTNNSRVIRLSSGRILLPGNLLYVNEEGGKVSINQRSACHFFYSDDDGKSWNEVRHCLQMPFVSSDSGLQETGIAEIRDGVLLAYSRTDLGMQYGSYSFDGGMNWTPVEPLRFFTSPMSPLKIQKLADGRFFAVWNPAPQYTCRDCDWDTARSPMAYAFSNDGINWYGQTVFEDDKDSGYSYPAIFSEEKYILVAYCAGKKSDGCNLNRLRIRKFYLD